MTTPDFIKKHPTPWKLEEVTPDPRYPNLNVHEEIQDANGGTVIAAYDVESYWAGFDGDVEEFVTFINNQFAN